MNQRESDLRLRERFVRWQAALRDVLGNHVALIVIMASGGLGFVGSIIKDDGADFSGVARWIIVAAAVFFLIALFLAVAISVNRLRDVRATLELLKRRREKSPQTIIRELENRTDALGRRTWYLVYLQLGTFTFAALLFTLGVFCAFEYKLFPQPVKTINRCMTGSRTTETSSVSNCITPPARTD